MMDLCEHIDDAKDVASRVADAYTKAAVFGNVTQELFYDFLRSVMYVRVLERSLGSTIKIKSYIPSEGQKVSLSSLTRQGNKLFLANQQGIYCSTTEIDSCLSDSEICKVVENSVVLGLKYQ